MTKLCVINATLVETFNLTNIGPLYSTKFMQN